MKKTLQTAGAMIIIASFVYLLVTLTKHAVALNPATWLLWMALDIVLAYSMHRSKHPARNTMTAFAAGAGTIAICSIGQLILGRTSWTWGPVETVTAICFTVAFLVRQFAASEKVSVNMGTTAMLIAGIPSVIDTWITPKSADPIFWGISCLGCMVTLAGTSPGFTNRYMPVGGTILNGLIAALAMGIKNWSFISSVH